MQTTRQRIIEYLELHHASSAIEMSRAFRTTSANLRHHLKILKDQGLVYIVQREKKPGRGRPTYLYMITHETGGNGLVRLTSALMQQILGPAESTARDNRLRKIAKKLTGRQLEGSSHLTQRLGETVEILNDLDYRAHWEAHSEGARIIFDHCPYADIINEYPELCQLDSMVIENFLRIEVEQISKIKYQPAGPHNCIFRVG